MPPASSSCPRAGPARPLRAARVPGVGRGGPELGGAGASGPPGQDGVWPRSALRDLVPPLSSASVELGLGFSRPSRRAELPSQGAASLHCGSRGGSTASEGPAAASPWPAPPAPPPWHGQPRTRSRGRGLGTAGGALTVEAGRCGPTRSSGHEAAVPPARAAVRKPGRTAGREHPGPWAQLLRPSKPALSI